MVFSFSHEAAENLTKKTQSHVNLVYEGFKEGEFSAQSPPVGACLGLIHGAALYAEYSRGQLILMEETKVWSFNFNMNKSLLDEGGLVSSQPRANQQDASGDHLQFSVGGATS